MNPTAEKFGYPQSVLGDYDHWLVQLRPAQVTLGSLVLVCKESAARFGELSEFEVTIRCELPSPMSCPA